MEIRKLLVANRGEIAVRVFGTCRRLGIGAVAAFAPDDEGAFHTRRADEAVAVGSYLDPAELVRAARESGKRPEFISAATPVQVGVAQILFLTENGYTLVRP